MFNSNHIIDFKNRLEEASTVLVLLPPEPELDQVVSASALYLTLKQYGKKAKLGCSSSLSAFQNIPGVTEADASIGQQNLVISFPYHPDAIAHVTYDIDERNGKFNLKIEPKEGADPLDPQKVQYKFTGAKSDLVVAFGLSSLEELGKIYADEKDFLDKAIIASVSLTSADSQFATFSFHSNLPSSNAEATTILMKSLNLVPSVQAATSLYQHIYQSTNNLTSQKVTADTFESLATLLRAGAERNPAPQKISSPEPVPTTPVINPEFFGVQKPSMFAYKDHQNQNNNQRETASVVPKEIPTDWKGPKIFRASEGTK